MLDTLDCSDLVILIITSSVTKSKWVQTEINRAKANNTPIMSIPLIHTHDCNLKRLRNELGFFTTKFNKALNASDDHTEELNKICS